MKRKNNFVKIIVAVAVVLFGFIGFYFYQMNNFTGGIISAHFEVFPEGTEVGPNSVGMITDSFGFGNVVGVSGESDVSKEVGLTFKVFDSYGNQVESEWRGDKIKIREGSFGFCCISVPQTSGEYTLKLFLNNRESKRMTFKVFS
jgi:hypothetical protein